MTFLIISDNSDFITTITSKIKNLEKTSKIYKSDFSEAGIKKIKKHLSDLSLCFIFSENSNNLNQDHFTVSLLSSLCGYVIAKEISVATNLDFLSKQILFTKNDLVSLQTPDDFIKFIEKKYDFISNQSKKREARKILLEKGIPFTPECFATYIAKDKIEICNLFLSGGIDINACDDLGTPMLNVAVRNENEELVKTFIELGANINAISADRGYTPLMDAVWKGNKTITKLLISYGAELNTISKEGQSNLVLAVGADRVEIVKLLAENGADPDIKDQMGMSAYNYATLFRKEKIVEILKPYHKE